MAIFTGPKPLNLALQGGGAHGAFTWGVLDRLLEDEALPLGWISGTSAGAVNAIAVASGLANGGRTEARATLKRVWDAVEIAGVSDLARINPFLYGMTRGAGMAQMGSLLSPYDFNPLGFDPLRKLLTAHIDFAKVRADTGRGIDLLIAATDIGTGRARLFRRAEMTIEAVLASACLPQIHHAVEIEGRAYWDGGFSANPDVVTLATESPAGDTLIVQLNPLERLSAPRTARDIAAHVNTITFNQPLLSDIATIVSAQEERTGRRLFLGLGRPTGRLARLARHRFHVIDAGRHTASLSAESKGVPERAMLDQLFRAGRSEASRWLERHRADIGRRQTADLRQRYLENGRARLPAKDTGADDAPDADNADDQPAPAGNRI